MNEKPFVGLAKWNKGNTVAELYATNDWLVFTNGERDLQLESNLRSIYSDRLVYSGPQDGYYGYAILADLAKTHGGSFRFYRPRETATDIAY